MKDSSVPKVFFLDLVDYESGVIVTVFFIKIRSDCLAKLIKRVILY